ncbi:hypothetical protein [uncultured Maritimibacter sp.]|jgi:hypothetical protein|uniref:hypothetical protein n=1 Tax=uncultured Maritimibacter sp. TaxID=991866 RepID=UPI00260A66E9|nr:hypothetical protein [uncultured Maritimibacter sp.]
MKNRFSILYILGLLALIVLPTVASLGWFAVTKNPNLRPLGVTEENLRAFDKGGAEGVRIVAQVDWAQAQADGVSRAEVERLLRRAFAAKGLDVTVSFSEGAERMGVTYRVGYSRIGPYALQEAALGVNAAVDAYHMHAPVS